MKHKLTRLTALMLAVILSFSTLLVPVQAASFTDVPEKAWYRKAVEYVSDKGWMNGVGEMTFAPTMNVTRGMFVTLLAAYADVDVDNSNAAFADTGAGKWYTGAAAWAAEQEIVKGIGSGQFAPNRSISRQDLCTMLYKYLQSAGIQLKADSDRTYADFSSVSPYAREAVAFCAASGLVTGFEDGSFRPKNTATRAQVAQILMRLDQLRQGEELPEDPMPAQSFEPVEAGEMTVSVEAPQGALPENTNMTVRPVTDEARLAAIRSKVIGKLYAAADISFSKDGEEIEPSAEVEVQIAMDSLDDIKNPSVVHVRDDGNVEYVEAELVNVNRSGSQKALRFRASRFSVYAVIGDSESSSLKTVTVSFYVRKNGATGGSDSENDWQIINRQKLRLDQLTDPDNDSPIYDPGVPDMTTTQSFEGWFYNNGGFTESDTGETMDVINARAKEYAAQSTTSEDESWDFYAMVYNVVYIQYHDQNGAIVRTDYDHLDAHTGKASVDIDEEYVPFKSNQTFSGWVTEDKVASKGDDPTYNTVASDDVYQVGSTYTIGGTLELYPYLQKGYWLSFNNNVAKNSTVLGFEDNTSAEYISPKFYAEGVAPGSAPAFSSTTPRPGYNFVGWYVDADMTTAFDFSQELTQDTTVYAKWSFGTTSYRVLYWKQRATDAYDAADSAKVYDYAGSRPVSSVTTGTRIGINSTDTSHSVADNNENAFYFQLNANKSDKTVAAGSTVRAKGDGTTVLNVYFDRKTITFRFGNGTETYFAVSSPDWSSGKTYYVKSGSSYLECFKTSAGYYYKEYTGTKYTDTTYYIIYNNSIYELSYNSYYRDFVFYDDGYYTWSGTVYTRSSSAPSGTIYDKKMTLSSVSYTYKGLYGHLLPSSEWPSAGSGKVWSNYDEGTATAYDYPLALTEYVPTWQNGVTTLQLDFYRSDYSTDVINVYYVGQSLTNTSSYDVQLATGTTTRGGSWYPSETIQGYTIRGYRFGTSGSWTSCTTNSKIDVSSSQTSPLYVAFNRNTYTLTYSSTTNTGTHTSSESILYEKNLADYKAYTPSDSYPGYYFAGWYLDEAGTKPFDLEKMPARNVLVYAKWNPKWYRIEVDYKRGNDCTVTVPGTTQKASFTVQYGSQVQTSALMKAKRVDADGNNNWLLVGLFLDEACTKPFNENMQAPFGLTEAQEVYPDSQRTGVDQLTNEEWSDLGYPDIRARITLYALWRQDPEGTIGIDVTYLGDHSDTDTGYFDVNQNPKPHIWRDESQLYTDQAKAYAHAASIPDTQGEQFLYWEILDSEGEPTGRKVYPGGTWTVHLADAAMVREKLPDPRCPHTARSAVEAVEPTCTEAGNNAYFVCTACGKKFQTNDPADLTEYDPTVPALGHNWGEWSATTAPTCTQEGVETRACSRCDAVQTRAAAALGHNVEGVAYSYDDSGHWQLCTRCGARVNEAEHTLEEDMSQYVAPTATSAGRHVYKCTACDYSETEVIPAIHEVTVTFAVPEGVTPVQAKTVESNTAITLPTASAPNGYTFLGWRENSLDETTEEPTDVLAADSSYTVEDTITLHALYSRTVEGEAVTCYQQVSTQPDSWVGNYVVSYLNNENAYVMDRVSGGSTYESEGTGVALSSAGITLQGDKLYNVASRYVFRIAARGSSYTMQNASNNTYVGRYVTYTSQSAQLRSYSSYDSTYCRWSFAVQSGGNVQILNNYDSFYDNNFPYIGFYTEASCFWVDGLGSEDNGYTNARDNMYLWKETTERPRTTYYTTEINGAGNNGNEDADSQELIGTSEAVTGLQNEAQSAAQDQTDAQVGTVVEISGKSTENGTTPKGADQGGDGTNAVTVDSYYVEVTKPVVGERYLIAYVNGSTVKVMGNSYPSATPTYNLDVVNVSSAAHGSYGVTLTPDAGVDLSNYLYTVGGTAGAYTLRNGSAGYLAYNSGGFPILTSSSATYGTWSWSTSTGFQNVNWTGDAYYYLGYDDSSDYFGAIQNGQSYFKLYKPVSVEIAASDDSVTYHRVSAITPGKQYVIVSKGYAATATAYNTSKNRALASVAVSVSGEYVTVPASSVDSVLWYVDGNADDGYTFLNLSSNKYLSLKENDVYWLAPLSTGWAWTYNGTDLDNHCVESGNSDNGSYYRYLYVSSGNQFSTSVSPNQDIQLYERVVSSVASHKLTIHYVYEGGGTALEDYKTFVEEDTAYEVESPSINGYTPDPAVVSGTMRTEDVVVTVTYSPEVISGTGRNVTVVDEDGNPVEGFPSFQIEDGSKISFENEPSREDYYFLGWFQDGGDEEFDFDTEIHSDITLVAKFMYMWKVSYTVTLRAVYGMRNETGDTHVYWYANDGTDAGHGEGAGDRYESEFLNPETNLMEAHIPLNTGVRIPLPYDDVNADTVNWKGTQSETAGLYRPGYTFLGWARLEVEGTGVNGKPHPDLTETDLYLKWDAENQQYLYRPWVDGKTEINGTTYGENDWVPVTQFYADEGRPYHDMYAVWVPGNFYVFHSATGKLEAISYLSVKNSDSGTINLMNHVTPGYLYGGYYVENNQESLDTRSSGYGYISALQMNGIVKGYETGVSQSWASMTATAADDPVAVHTVSAQEVQGFKTYDGTARYLGGGLTPTKDAEGHIIAPTAPIWNSANAATVRGTSLEPEAGKVYCLKEVPSAYLSAKAMYTYDTTAEGRDIQDIWIVTLADDNNYRRVGFKTVAGQDAGALSDTRFTGADKLAKTFTLKPRQPSDGSAALPATKVDASSFGMKAGAGYVAFTQRTDLVNGGKPNFTMLPGWITYDRVAVYNNGTNWKYVDYSNDANKPADWEKHQLTWARTFDGTEKLYIDMSEGDGVGDGWTGANAVIKFMFYDAAGNNSGYVDTRATGDGSIYEVTVPTGNWIKFLVKRLKPDGTGEWDSTGDIPLNQDKIADPFQDGADIASNVNLIDWFEKNNTHVHWGHYPAIPS